MQLFLQEVVKLRLFVVMGRANDGRQRAFLVLPGPIYRQAEGANLVQGVPVDGVRRVSVADQ